MSQIKLATPFRVVQMGYNCIKKGGKVPFRITEWIAMKNGTRFVLFSRGALPPLSDGLFPPLQTIHASLGIRTKETIMFYIFL